MTSISINDLQTTRELDATALSNTDGGFYGHWLYRSIYSYFPQAFYNPFVGMMQQNWIGRGIQSDLNHQAAIARIRA